MSRRRGEFEHRTSIFEGAFRAWSHLGGLQPEDVESKPTADLDPLANPLLGGSQQQQQDARLASARKNGDLPPASSSYYEQNNPDGSARREYPYEPLPRSGLSHPYVQAILSPWLGPDADNEAIQLGLTTLRTWWQHRRKGESGSAVAALGTEKMKGVVEGYTRHFFTLAHCLVMNDKEQPPRTLHGRMKELEKMRSKRNKKRAREEEAQLPLTVGAVAVAAAAGGAVGGGVPSVPLALVDSLKNDLTDSKLTPLERLHAAQRRQLAQSGMIHSNLPGQAATSVNNTIIGNSSIDYSAGGAQLPIIDIKGKCIPGKIDLGLVVDQISHHATQLAHRGSINSGSGGGGGTDDYNINSPNAALSSGALQHPPPPQYGDPNTTPVVFVSSNGDIQFAMAIDGITCAHCVKIVETVLRGCNGNKSPIEGLLDAAADRVLMSVLVKIDMASKAKRIAFEATRNLAMVGYTAKAKEMSIVSSGTGADKKATLDLGALSTAFEVVANTDAKDFFDWTLPCTCPDNGILREDCPRHSQMNTRIFDAFDAREQQVNEYMAGCAMRYGMSCTCGPNCRCKNCPLHHPSSSSSNDINNHSTTNHNSSAAGAASAAGPPRPAAMGMMDRSESSRQMPAPPAMQMDRMQAVGVALEDNVPISIDQRMSFFAMEPHPTTSAQLDSSTLQHHNQQHQNHHSPMYQQQRASVNFSGVPQAVDLVADMGGYVRRASQRNASIISHGGLRHMSINSETTFGRAMSGLSALSIDWENLEDFDVEVDHSSSTGRVERDEGGGGGGGAGGGGGGGRRRSSLRRSYLGGVGVGAEAAAAAATVAAQNGAGTPPSSADQQEAHVAFKV